MAEVGDIYPGTNERIVGVVYPEGGGKILQGEFGGVFAEGGAQFHGSYFSPELASARNDPNRRFTGIELLEGGGYRSITSNPNELGYAFRPPSPTPAPVSTPAPVPPTPQQQRADFSTTFEGISAKGTLAATLAQYGLPTSLADTLWNNWYVNEGRPLQQILIDIRTTPEFRQRFPGIAALEERRNRGEAVMVPTVEQYQQLETGLASVLRDAGLPSGFYDEPSDFAKWIGGSTSPKEVQDRIDFARNLAFSAPVEVRQNLDRVYGIEEGELIAWALDPDRVMPELQKKVNAAVAGGMAQRSGFGLLTQSEMEQLAGSGVSAATESRFGELAQMGQGLFEETIEERQAGSDLGRETQIGYAAGSGAAVADIESRRRSRQAQFQGGGGAATGGGGRTGLG